MGTGPDTLMIDRGHRATVVPCKFLTKRFKVGGPEGVLNCIVYLMDMMLCVYLIDSTLYKMLMCDVRIIHVISSEN